MSEFANADRAAGSPRRLLVIAGFPPEGGGGGGVILRSLFESYPASRLAWLSMRPDRTKRTRWFKPEMKQWTFPLYVPGRLASSIGATGAAAVGSWINALGVAYATRVIRRVQPTDVLIVVDGELARTAVRILARFPKVRVHLSVHDDPLVVAAMAPDGAKIADLSRQLSELCSRAATIDCISSRMASTCRSRYRTEPMVVTRCIAQSRLERFERKSPRSPADPLRIILSGWGDCPAPWPDDLLATLSLLQTERAIEFHSFDSRVQSSSARPWIVNHRHMPEAEFDRVLATMDVSYAPDPFTPGGRLFAASSLSTKIVTSICAGIPFVYHGPLDSTVSDLLASEPLMGVVVEGHEPESIARAFRSVIDNHAQRVEACRSFARVHFGSENVRPRFLGRFE